MIVFHLKISKSVLGKEDFIAKGEFWSLKMTKRTTFKTKIYGGEENRELKSRENLKIIKQDPVVD